LHARLSRVLAGSLLAARLLVRGDPPAAAPIDPQRTEDMADATWILHPYATTTRTTYSISNRRLACALRLFDGDEALRGICTIAKPRWAKAPAHCRKHCALTNLGPDTRRAAGLRALLLLAERGLKNLAQVWPLRDVVRNLHRPSNLRSVIRLVAFNVTAENSPAEY
jgi:hypothetical protein